MANFTTISLDGNTGSLASPTWTALGGSNTEVRWSDSAAQDNVASASWPAMVRPSATGVVSYTYAFTADATGTGFIGSAGPPPAFSNNNYLWARWDWDAVGTFASAPIWTAYPTSSHGSVTAGDDSLLGGNTTDTTDRSYLKGNAYGQLVSVGAPTAAPTNAPAVTDGTTGSLSPTAGTSWLTNYQDLQGDNDYITFPSTPAATTADQWNVIFSLFVGPNETPSTYTVVTSLRYTWT